MSLENAKKGDILIHEKACYDGVELKVITVVDEILFTSTHYPNRTSYVDYHRVQSLIDQGWKIKQPEPHIYEARSPYMNGSIAILPLQSFCITCNSFECSLIKKQKECKITPACKNCLPKEHCKCNCSFGDYCLTHSTFDCENEKKEPITLELGKVYTANINNHDYKKLLLISDLCSYYFANLEMFAFPFIQISKDNLGKYLFKLSSDQRPYRV